MKEITPAELEEMRRADEEIEKDFCLTQEERRASMEEDREVRAGRLDNRARRRFAYQAEYRAANREKIAAYQAEYRAANREKIAARRKAKREKKKGESGK